MNKTEARYAARLAAMSAAGEIAAWWREPVTLRIGHDCRYTPDFMVILPDGGIELHEVKGFWRDDAKVKIRVAAAAYPCFSFVVIHEERGGSFSRTCVVSAPLRA